MKLIILQAFGGLLQSEYIQVQDYPKDYRVPYRKEKPFSFATPVDLSKIDSPTFRTALFLPADRFMVLENKNSALIYELESM